MRVVLFRKPLSFGMSTESVCEPTQCERDGESRVPVQVLDAITNVIEGGGASKDEL